MNVLINNFGISLFNTLFVILAIVYLNNILKVAKHLKKFNCKPFVHVQIFIHFVMTSSNIVAEQVLFYV